jgi:hypothetical protein
MRHSPSWGSNRSSPSQEIPRTVWNAKVHHRIHKRPPTVPILRHINPIHASSYFLKINFHIALPPTPSSSRWSLSLRAPNQNPLYTSPVTHACHMPRPFHLHFITPLIFGEYRWQSSSLCSLLHSLLAPDILLSTLSRTPSAYIPPSMTDQVTNPYRTVGIRKHKVMAHLQHFLHARTHARKHTHTYLLVRFISDQLQHCPTAFTDINVCQRK